MEIYIGLECQKRSRSLFACYRPCFPIACRLYILVQDFRQFVSKSRRNNGELIEQLSSSKETVYAIWVEKDGACHAKLL